LTPLLPNCSRLKEPISRLRRSSTCTWPAAARMRALLIQRLSMKSEDFKVQLHGGRAAAGCFVGMDGIPKELTSMARPHPFCDLGNGWANVLSPVTIVLSALATSSTRRRSPPPTTVGDAPQAFKQTSSRNHQVTSGRGVDAARMRVLAPAGSKRWPSSASPPWGRSGPPPISDCAAPVRRKNRLPNQDGRGSRREAAASPGIYIVKR